MKNEEPRTKDKEQRAPTRPAAAPRSRVARWAGCHLRPAQTARAGVHCDPQSSASSGVPFLTSLGRSASKPWRPARHEMSGMAPSGSAPRPSARRDLGETWRSVGNWNGRTCWRAHPCFTDPLPRARKRKRAGKRGGRLAVERVNGGSLGERDESIGASRKDTPPRHEGTKMHEGRKKNSGGRVQE